MFFGGVFLVTAATLMLQVIQTRILSVVAWYHLAFFVISIGMFGLTAGAVWVYQRGGRFTERTLSHDLAYFSAAFAGTTALSLALQMILVPIHLPGIAPALTWVVLAVSLSVPFFFAGVVVSLALTRSPYAVGSVYGIDLLGAAAGCLGALAVLDATDGPSGVLWVAATAAAAAVLFARSGLGAAPRDLPPLAALLRRPRTLLVLLAAAAALNGQDQGLRPIAVKGNIEMLTGRPLFEEWNSFSRIAVFGTPRTVPAMWGPSPRFRDSDWTVEQRRMNIDGQAGTATYRFDGDIADARFLEYDVTNLAYFLPGRGSAAVIGVGGGRDMLSARVFGVPDVTGIEINPIFVRLLTREPGFADFSGLAGLAGMTFEVDEARSWFARTERRFDLIQMSLIDTWAATGAGAYTLSENGLYTREAWRIFLDRLAPGGVFTVSRWYAPGDVNETGRMVSLAVAAALDDGAGLPRRRIFLAASGSIATLVLARDPFSAVELAALEAAAADKGYSILAGPNSEPATPVLRSLLAAGSQVELDRAAAAQDLDLSPPTDERPFFFNQLPFRDPVKILRLLAGGAPSASGAPTVGVVRGNLMATVTLALLFALSAALVLATIVVPLRPAIADAGGRLAYGGSAYFFLIGAGFMSVEIGLLQRLSVFLGHPTYSLSVVLFSLILSTGLGSLLSERLPLDGPGKFAVWSAATGAYLLALPSWLPAVVLPFDGATLLVRAALCVLVIAPAGLLMGYGFPTGMRLVGAVDRRPTPWFWGINGAAGVLASSLAVACSIAFGIGVTLMIAALCYLLLLPAAAAIGFRGRVALAGAPA